MKYIITLTLAISFVGTIATAAPHSNQDTPSPAVYSPGQRLISIEYVRMTTDECESCCWSDTGGVWVQARAYGRGMNAVSECLADYLTPPCGGHVVFESSCGSLRRCPSAWSTTTVLYFRGGDGQLHPYISEPDQPKTTPFEECLLDWTECTYSCGDGCESTRAECLEDDGGAS